MNAGGRSHFVSAGMKMVPGMQYTASTARDSAIRPALGRAVRGPKGPAGKLQLLEALRGVAALLVVFYHLQDIFVRLAHVTPLGGLFGAGDRGVDIFFVLSGFIIARSYSNDIGKPSRLAPYLYGRVCRIYPSVWILTACAAVVYLGGFGGEAKAWKLDPWNVIASGLLLPQGAPPLVNVTWTLTYEMFFYVLFSILLVSRWLGLGVLLAWQAGAALQAILPVEPANPFLAYYLRPICLELGIGMLCAWLVARPAVRRTLGVAGPWLLFALGSMTIIACLMLEAFYVPRPLSALRWWTYGSAAACVIAGLTLLEQRGRLGAAWPLATLGQASYAIYLVHFSVITGLAVALTRSGIPVTNLMMASCALLAILAGIVFHYCCDAPIQRRLRGAGRRVFADRNPALLAIESHLPVRGGVRSQ